MLSLSIVTRLNQKSDTSEVIWEKIKTKHSYRLLSNEKNIPNKVVILHSENYNQYATAEWHEKFLDTTNRKVSFHFVIDDSLTIQTYPLEYVSYHTKGCNPNTISILLCENQTEKAERLLISLVAYLVRRYNLSTDKIIHKSDCSNSPNRMNLEEFRQKVESAL